MADSVVVRPLRSHQSRTLRRWVQSDEDPYSCPADEAERLVRHGIVEVVEDNANPNTSILSDGYPANDVVDTSGDFTETPADDVFTADEETE